MTAPRLTLLVIMSLLVAMTTVQAADVTSELQELYDTGKLDQAIEKAQQMLERKKRSADLRYFIGTCYEKKLDFDKAEEFYLEALDRSSGHLPTLYRLGKLLVKDSTRLEEAKGYFDEGLKRAKEDHEKAMFEDGLGLYFLAKGEYSQADRKFRTAEYLDPANCDYKMHLGDANYEKGALTLALTSYTDVLNECDSLNPEVHFRIGVANVKQKRYNEALKDFANAIRLDSAYVQAYQYYGKINILAALASEDQQGALDLYRSAYWSFRKQIEFGYDVPEAYYYLAKVYSALGHSDSAATYFQNAVDAGYDRSDLYSDLGKSYSKAGDYSKAIQVLTEYIDGVLAEDPSHEWTADDVELFLAVARAYAGLDSCELRHEAADYFRQAWELDSTDVTVLT
jgi:tetratricopeptide (TPR) repeat protein